MLRPDLLSNHRGRSTDRTNLAAGMLDQQTRHQFGQRPPGPQRVSHWGPNATHRRPVGVENASAFGGGNGAPWQSPRFSSEDAWPPLSRLIPARLGPPWLPRASPARLARPGKPSAVHRPAPCGVEHPDGDLLRMRSTTADKTAARQQAGLSIDHLMDANRPPGPCISSCSPSLSSSQFGRDADGVQAAAATRARPQAATRKICVFK